MVVGEDGTIYLLNEEFLYGISSDGKQKWIYSFPDKIGLRNLSIAKDGTIYVLAGNNGANIAKLYAFSPDGDVQIIFSDMGFICKDFVIGDAADTPTHILRLNAVGAC